MVLRKIVYEQDLLLSKNVQERINAGHLRYMNLTQSALMPIYVLTGDLSLIKTLESERRQFEESASQLLEHEEDAGNRQLLTKILNMSHDLSNYAGPGIQMRQAGASIAQVNKYFSKKPGPEVEDLNVQLGNLIERKSAALANAKLHMKSTVNRMIWALIGFALFALTLVVLIGRLIVKVVGQQRAYDQAQQNLLMQERRLSQARKEIVEVVSHDLKSPLGTVKMSLELLREQMEESAPPETLEKSLQITDRSVQSMERLIRDLLDQAKIEAGQFILEKEDCDLGLLVRDLALRFAPLAKKRNIRFRADIRDNSVIANCDLGRVEQVLTNLIGNAFKFTPADGQVAVEARASGREILIAVKDSGSGVAPDQLSHIFDRYWQVRETAKQGTGLGLAIAKAIIDAHQGKIWVESEVGQGSTFYVSLPRSNRPYRSPSEPKDFAIP